MKRMLALVLGLMLLAACMSAGAVQSKYVLPVSGIALDRTSASAYAGRTFTIKSKVTPASRAHEVVDWASDNEAVATVAGGVVTTHAPGVAVITAAVEDGGAQFEARCRLTVKAAPVLSFRLSHTAIALSPGDSLAISGQSFLPKYAYDQTLTFKSANPAVATVSADGLVTAVGLGSTRIRATAVGGRIATCTVTVTSEVRAKSVALNATAKVMASGQTFQLTATVKPSTAIQEDQVITYASSNPLVATVDAAGLITAHALWSTTTITATTGNGRTARMTVTVKPIEAKTVTLAPGTLTLDIGDEAPLTLTVTPKNAAYGTVQYASSNEAVAVVDQQGRVAAVAPGTAKITVMVGGKKGAMTVRVRSEERQTVTITAVGDITIGGDPRRPAPASEKHYNELYARYNGRFLSGVQSLFGGADELTLVNLESNLTTATQFNEKTYIFRGKPAYAGILSTAGVDIVGHANNHASDFLAVGARQTRSAVTSHDMAYVAGGVTAVRKVGSVSVGFAAFNALGGDVKLAMEKAVKSLKQRADIVVVSFHWGADYAYAASASQRNLGRAAVLAGADLVVGHHSHLISGIEVYRGKTIVYGLGTLSSAILTPKDMDTLVFQQTFTFDPVIRTVESQEVKLIPCSMSSEDLVNDAQPVILTGAARSRVLSKLRYYSAKFPQTLPDECFS